MMNPNNVFGFLRYPRENQIVGIIFVIAILLPHTGLLYLINPILLIYLILKCSPNIRCSKLQIALSVIILLSILWNAFWDVDISTKSLIRSIYVLLIILCFPFCKNIRIPLLYIYLVVITILVSQICYIYNWGTFISVIEQFYPYEGDVAWFSSDYLLDHASDAGTDISKLEAIRFGGLFHNSNQCMKYVSLCTIVFMVENYKNNMKSSIPFLIVVLSSAVLAGSRTGFAIILLTVVIAYSIKLRYSSNMLGYFVIILGFVCIVIISNYLSQDFRIFKISEGFNDEGSISIKYYNLSYYLNNPENIRAYLVGNASIENIKQLYNTPFTQFDSEWGNAIYFYGFSFFICYFIFIIKTIFKLKGIYIISAFMLIWMISSTVLFSYRTSFAFFLILSKYITASNKFRSKV